MKPSIDAYFLDSLTAPCPYYRAHATRDTEDLVASFRVYSHEVVALSKLFETPARFLFVRVILGQLL